MSLPDLAAVLWRQRELLELLAFRLECERMILAGGRNRWLPAATTEVETLLSELRVIEMQRAAVSDAAAREFGLRVGATLEEAMSLLLREDKSMVGVTQGARFLGVLTPNGIHAMLRADVRAERT
jgi:hypothetical protein